MTVGLLGEDGVEGNTEVRKLEAGDGGTEENGEDASEKTGDTGRGGGGGGGKSWAGPDGEGRLVELKKGGGGGGKDGEVGDSTLPALARGGVPTRPKGLCEVAGDSGEGLDPEEPEDWVA